MDDFSTIYESDFREKGCQSKGIVALNASADVFSRATKKGLCFVCISSKTAPDLQNLEEVLDQVMIIFRDGKKKITHITYLVDGLDNAKIIAVKISKMAGVPVGIARYAESGSTAYSNAQIAAINARSKGELFHIYDQKEEDAEMEEIKRKFSAH